MIAGREQDVPPRPVQVSFALPLSRPRVTWVLLVVIVAVFAVETAAGGSTATDVLIRLGAMVTHRIASGEYWRLLTSMFLHIGAVHLLFNAYALFALGSELERLFGWEKLLVIYLVAGSLGSLVSYAFRTGLSAGASGAIFGLIGSLGAYFALYRQQLGTWGQRRLANVVFLIGANLLFGFTQPGIDNLAHLGGLFAGLGLGWALAPRYRVDPVALRLVDRNHLRRYWPALVVASAVLVGGSYLATQRHRASAEFHLSRGQDALDRESWGEVATELGQVVSRFPQEATASVYFVLGLAHDNLGETAQASEAYEAALELGPEDSTTRWYLALSYLELGREAEACQQFRAYLELRPEYADEILPYIRELRCPAW